MLFNVSRCSKLVKSAFRHPEQRKNSFWEILWKEQLTSVMEIYYIRWINHLITLGTRKSLDLSGPPGLYPQTTSPQYHRWKMFHRRSGPAKTFGLENKILLNYSKVFANWIKSCFIQKECLICLKIKFSSPKIQT